MCYHTFMRFSSGGLSNSDRASLKQAAQVAATGDVRKFKLGAVVKRGGRILSVGVNTYKTYSPDFEETDKYPPRNQWTVHAEVAALRSLNFDARGAILYVARVNKYGDYRMSKPCKNCMAAIQAAGIKRVVYTIDNEIDLEK